jgi:Nuclease-related domain
VASTVPKVRRTAGQSIRDEKERLTDNRLVPYYFSCVFAWAVWALEEFKARTHEPPHPKLLLCLAIIVTGVAAIAFGRLFRKFRHLNRGERGETKVAEVLDELRSSGYRPVHDLVGTGYNIDHVIVGPAGVFVIETKFRGGYGEVEFRNGDGLFIGGRKEEKDPLHQARSNAGEVNRLLKEHCGKYFWVTPLVVFVGDWKIKNRWRETNGRLFSTDQLVRYFEGQQPELTRSEIKLIASHLERSVKS